MQPISSAPEQDAKTETARQESPLQDSPQQLQTWSAPQLVRLAGENAESDFGGPGELPDTRAVS